MEGDHATKCGQQTADSRQRKVGGSQTAADSQVVDGTTVGKMHCGALGLDLDLGSVRVSFVWRGTRSSKRLPDAYVKQNDTGRTDNVGW